MAPHCQERQGPPSAPAEGNSNPLQYSCLENPTNGRAWRATVHGLAKNWTQLSTHTHTHTHTHARVSTWLENLCKAMPEGQLGSCLGSKGCFCYHQDLWLRHSPAISYNFPSPAGYSMRAANAWPHLSQPKHHRYTSAPMLSFWKIRAGVPDQDKHRAGTSNPVQELGMLSLESECK